MMLLLLRMLAQGKQGMTVNSTGRGSFSYHVYGIKAPSAVVLRGLFPIPIASTDTSYGTLAAGLTHVL